MSDLQVASGPAPPTGTITFLFTDIEGSTQLWERFPEAMSQALRRHDVLLHQVIAAQGGYVFKTVGDAFCAAFDSAPNALAAALLAQQQLKQESDRFSAEPQAVGTSGPAECSESPVIPASSMTPLRVRMALHTGVAEKRDNDYFGPVLNRTARILAIGHGEQILLSRTTQELVQGALPEGGTLRDQSSHRLKDLQQPEQIFQLLHPALPADFPPLRSLNPTLHNLPVQLTSFVGREEQIAEVKRRLAKTRLLTLSGSGGCGKTRLALQTAAEVVEEQPDGVWLVELAALTDPAFVPRTVAQTLGVREDLGQIMTRTLSEYLKPKNLLLVLDNCEHLLAACAELTDTLLRACPHLTILATSREGLGIAGEMTYRVPSLSLPDRRRLPPLETLVRYEAVRLFNERARFHQPEFALSPGNAPAVTQVCQRLDGIPLAIELAAARVRVLPVEQIATRLNDRFKLLTGGSRTALPRQQTLRALIDWSYELLSEKERLLLVRLSVFAGGWTLEAAEMVYRDETLEDWEILDVLASLVDKSLVVYDMQEAEGRYHLLETVRQYSRERLAERGETGTLYERHREFYTLLAERAEPEYMRAEQRVWLDRLEREHENLRVALETAEAGEARLRLAGALWWFWFSHAHFIEGQNRLEEALTHPAGSPAARAKALMGLGTMFWMQGQYARAEGLHTESLVLFRQLEDMFGIAFALNNVAVQIFSQHDFDRAQVLFEESLIVARKVEQPWLIHQTLNNLGELARCRGDYAQARPLYEETLRYAREQNDLDHLAITVTNLGAVLTAEGDFPAAFAYLQEGLRIRQQLGSTRSQIICLDNLAGLWGAQGQFLRAARLFGAVAAFSEPVQYHLEAADLDAHNRNLAAIRTALGDEAFAAALAEGYALTMEQAIACALEDG